MKYLFAAGLLLAAQSVSAATYQGYDVKEESFRIAGGEKVTLPVTKAGPIPAENERVKIEVAGFNIAFKDNPQTLVWQFGFQSKVPQKIEKITVEQVYDVDQPRAMLDVSAPELKGNTWFATTAAEPITKEANPWLHSIFSTTFIFKFTIAIEGEPAMVLYQPATFAGSTKARLVNMAKMIRPKE
jgi:hypothetical protein